VPAVPALMERVKRTNVIIINSQQQQIGFVPRYNPYTIEIDYEKDCYSCRGFGYIAKNYKNRRIVEQGKRINYKNNGQSNLNGKKESSIPQLGFRSNIFTMLSRIINNIFCYNLNNRNILL